MGGYDIVDCVFVLARIQPQVDAAFAHFSISEPEHLSFSWAESFEIDAALYGPILNQHWGVFVWGITGSEFSHCYILHQDVVASQDGYRDDYRNCF